MTTTLLFNFDDLGNKGKATKAVEKAFTRAGVEVASVRADPKLKRTAGVSYRELLITFGDSQMVTLRIKRTGDIFQVLLNKKIVPITNQDDHTKAVSEIVALMERGRSAFQKKLAKIKPKLPERIKTAAPKMEVALTQQRDDLLEAVDAARTELETIRAA
ncbi:MAG: hypothetical protein K9L88_11350 [Chromatiaceae bacterium]|nr:hypothetical protein [Chromatiaceae bacterium]